MEFFCMINDTFVLASFVAFHSVRHQKSLLLQVRLLVTYRIYLKNARALWPLRLPGGCMNATPIQGRAGYEWANKRIATQQCQVLPWKYAFRLFSKNGVYSTRPVCLPVEWLEWPVHTRRCMSIWVPRSSGPQIQVPGPRISQVLRSTEYSVPTRAS